MTDDGVAAPLRVVAAAIVRDGRVLAACRSHPPTLAGRWEFPGGKLEPAESAPQALVRECREELGVEVTVGEQLGETLGHSGTRPLVLTLYTAQLIRGEPRAGADHRSLRWLDVAALDSVDWLAVDVHFLPAVGRHLRERVGGGTV